MLAHTRPCSETVLDKSSREPLVLLSRQRTIHLPRLEFTLAAVEGSESTAEKAQQFWNRATKAILAMKRIILTSMLPRLPLPPPVGECDECAIIETLVACAPLDIQVQIAFNDSSDYPRGYALWQFANDASPTWQLIDPDWTPIRVLLPPRKFPPSTALITRDFAGYSFRRSKKEFLESNASTSLHN
jgi:hypothetical protein